MNKLRTKLALILMTVVGCSVLAAGLFMALMMERSHLRTLQDSMKREINIILSALDGGAEPFARKDAAYFAEKARIFGTSNGERVTFIAADGTVLGDSDTDAAAMENHLGREEIREAEAAGIGFARRHSETTGMDFLYAAVPVEEGGSVVGYVRLSISLDEIDQAIVRMWSVLLSGLLIVFVLAGLFSYRAAYRLTRPIEKITQVARQISNMNYKSRVYLSNRDEIGQLGEAVNAMAASLQNQMHRIMENENRLFGVLDNMSSGVIMIGGDGQIALVNRSAEEILISSADAMVGKRFDSPAAKLPYELVRLLERSIEKGERIRDEMVVHVPEECVLEVHIAPMRSEDEWLGLVAVLHDITSIRRLEKMRSDFVANVSHELKTPVAAVKGYAETLLAGAMNDEETARSFLNTIYEESERLNRLIGDILELSKIESKRAPLFFSPVDLSELIGKTLEMLGSEAAKKRIALSMHVEEHLFIEADEDRLRQILLNLLSNGINYTPEGGNVTVSAEAVEGEGDEPEKIRIIVSDTGIGIPKKDLPRIFERFYRVDKARSRSSGGTGLGLSIVKHLVELHNGSIRVESELDLGSRFIIELPLLQS